MNRKPTAMTLGFGIGAFLLFVVLLTVEIWRRSPGLPGPIGRQVNAAFGDPATQWMILSALAGYFILFCTLEHRLSPPGKWWRLGNADLWLSALVTLALLCHTFSNRDGIGGFSYVSTFLAGIVFGKAVSTLVRWRSAHLAQNTVWLAGSLICFLSVAALWQPGSGPGRGMIYHYHDIVRWSGIWRNPNHYGLMMGAGLVLAIGLGVRAWRVVNGKRRKMLCVILCSAAAVLCGCGVFKSYSRGTWLGVLAGLVYLAVQMGKSSRTFVWLHRNRLGLVLLVASLTLLTFWQFRFSEWPPAQRVFSVANINDFSWRNRLTAWEWAMRSMIERPLVGVGWRPLLAPNRQNLSPQQLNNAQAISTNDFLMLGASAGAPALLCFAAYLALSFRARSAAPGAPLSVFTICRGSSIVFLVGFWLDGGLFMLALALVFWMLMELSRLEPAEVKTDDAKSELENEPRVICAVSRSKGEIWLRRASLMLTAIALLQSAIYVGTPFFPANHLTLAIARKCLIPPGERGDLDFLASNPIWTGQKLRILLEHVDLANYNRRLINWKLDDSMYREYVLTPAIQPERDGLTQWRRPLWEFLYPLIRKQANPEIAAKTILPRLRQRVTISENVPWTIEEMWRRQTADAGGFEALCVAAFRSVGIAARLGEDGRAEFFDGKIWQPVSSLAK